TIVLSDTAPALFQNALNPFDVNGDGHVFPSDLVIVINDLIRHSIESYTDTNGVFQPGFALVGSAVPPNAIPTNATLAPAPFATYPDVNGDGKLTASDANSLVTALNNP